MIAPTNSFVMALTNDTMWHDRARRSRWSYQLTAQLFAWCGDRTCVSAVVSEDALQGSLQEFPLAALLQSLANRRRTGALTLEGGSEIWFSEGQIYLATSAKGSPISAVLFGAEAGSIRDIESMFASGDADGTVIDQLLESRPQAESAIRRLLHEYNLNALFEMLVPSKINFSFESNRRHKLGDRFAHDTATLLAQAQQRLDIWRKIAERIPSTNAVFRLASILPDNNYERLVSSDEWRYLAIINGRNTVADIITETGESAFRVCSTLYRMLLEQLVVEVQTPEAPVPRQ